MKKRQRYHSEENRSGSPDIGEPEFLAVGKLRRPHGLRGEMLIMVWTDFPERLQPGVEVLVGETHQPMQIKSLRAHNQASVIAFEGLDQREAAGQFRNQVVFVRTADLPPLPEDEIYLHQLLGLQVIRDEDAASLGRVAEILETGANNVLVIRQEGQADILLPDIDSVILKVDLEIGEIRVHLLPGLLPDAPA